MNGTVMNEISPAVGTAATAQIVRNAGTALDLGLIYGLRANRSAIERRCATLGGRRTVKKEHQAAWLLKAITCMDLTTLSGDDTEERVKRLCAKARQPISAELVAAPR